MGRKRLTIREVDVDAISLLNDIKGEERRELGAIIADCIYGYWEAHYQDEDTEPDVAQ